MSLKGSSDYGYINARIRAMTTSLLNKELLLQLINADSVESINNLLQTTDYSDDIKKENAVYPSGIEDYSLLILESAIVRNFERNLDKIKGMTEGEPRELLNLILLKWDIYNMKTIIRGKYFGLKKEEIVKNFLPKGDLSEKIIKKIIDAKDLAVIWEILEKEEVPFINFIREPYKESILTDNLLSIESAFDKWYYQYAISITSKDSLNENISLIHSAFKKEIDQVNAILALKMVDDKTPVNIAINYFIENGEKVSKKIFLDLLDSKDINICLEKLGNIAFKEEIKNKIDIFKKIADISIFERTIEASNARFIWRKYRENLLSFGVVLGYLKLKYNEIINLRVIARCRDFGVPTKIIEGEIIFGKV